MVMILSNYTKIMEETYAAFEKEKILGGIFDMSEIANPKNYHLLSAEWGHILSGSIGGTAKS